jgi:hypothetical protein
VFFVGLVLVTGLFAVNVTITWDRWPYGVRSIGDTFRWWTNPSNVSSVEVPPFNVEDTIWDLVDLGGTSVNENASAYIRPKTESPNPPAICTYAEKQVFHGSTSWGYEGMDTTGGQQAMMLYGIYTQGYRLPYTAPYDSVYVFPMQFGDIWSSAWTWDFSGDLVTETRDNAVVAQGWVRVPADTLSYYPCLVIETYSTSQDELGAINEARIIHEWVVPDMGAVGGSVASIQSQNNEINPGFTSASAVFKMRYLRSVIDRVAPTISNTTRVPSGYNRGPFVISAQITDVSGIARDSLYYQIGSQPWQVVGQDSAQGSTYFFRIPQLAGTDTVRYYIAAQDNAPARNRATDPYGAPGNHYQFYARDPADDHYPPVITGTTQYNDTAFEGPFPVSALVVDSCSVDSVLLIYRLNSGSENTVSYDSAQGSRYFLTLPAAAMGTFIRYKLRAVDGSPNQNAAFDPPTGYYSFNVMDASGPAIESTTVWPDTTFPGPFLVRAGISDPSGIEHVALFYKLGTANWDSLPADSSAGPRYFMHIPSAASPMSIRYYVKAVDNAQNHNIAFDPANAPNGYYLFFCDPRPGIAGSELLPHGFALDLKSINPRTVSLTVPARGRLEVAVYDAKGSRLAELSSGLHPAGGYSFALPEGLANGNYLLDVNYEQYRVRHSFVVTR